MYWQPSRGHRGYRRQRGPQRRESSTGAASDFSPHHENLFDTYDRDKRGFDLEFLIDPLVLSGVVSQLLIVLVLPASFDDTRGEVL